MAPGESFGTVGLAVLDAPIESGELSPLDVFIYLGCTGTLIAPTVVVTAAHCVDICLRDFDCAMSDDPEQCSCETAPPPDGAAFVIVGLHDMDDVWTADYVSVRDAYIHEGYDSFGDWGIDPETGLSNEGNDIAVLVLDRPVSNIPSIPLLPPDDPAALVTGLAQGYGFKTQVADRQLLSQGDFESLLNEIESPIELLAERELLTFETEEGGTVCFGDSGGPLYARSGSGVHLLGIASRSKSMDNGGLCESGAVYTLAPSYAEWIYEKAPEAIPAGGGRCSVSPFSDRPSPLIPLAALAVLLLVCVRRMRTAVAAFVLLTIGLLGCGCGGGDGPGAGGSLCTEDRDPLGVYCDPETARIDLQSAERIAREIVPDGAWFWGASAWSEGGVNPDGEAELWLFEYFLPEQSEPPTTELLSIAVYASGERESAMISRHFKCIPTRPITPMSSRAVVHDAIRRLQSEGVTVRLGEGAILELYQAHRCSTLTDGWNVVAYDQSLVFFDASGGQLGFYQYPLEPQPTTRD